MNRLIGVELRRILSRRLVRLLVLGVFVVLAVINIGQAFNHTNDLGKRQAQITAEVQSQRATGGYYGFECEDGFNGSIPQDPETGRPILPPQCHEPSVDEIVAQRMQYEDPRFLMVRDGKGMLVTGMVVSALLAFLLSASAIGAEWNSGMFASLLTWEPRRPRVLLAKTAACVLFFTVLGALIIGFELLSAAALAQTRGSFVGMQGPVTRELAGMVGRGIGLVALTAAAGAALAGIARSTAGAMAILAGYVVAVEAGLRSLLDDDRWLLSRNTQALVAGHVTIYVPGVERPLPGGGMSYDGGSFDITAGRAALVIAAIVLLVTVVHGLLLQRRDAN